MGCGGSKLGAGEAAPGGMGLGVLRRRIEEVRRRSLHRGRVRKDSIVSTMELLHHHHEEEEEEEEEEEDSTAEEMASRGGSLCRDAVCNTCGAPYSLPRDSSAASRSPPTVTAPPPPHTEPETAEEKGEEKVEGGEEVDMKDKKVEQGGDGEDETAEKVVDGEERERERGEEEKGKGDGDGEEKAVGGAALLFLGGGGRLGYQEEDLPGSPSFRVYCEDSLRGSSDDDSVYVAVAGERDEKEERSPGRKDSTTSDESEGKSSKKHRAKKLKALTKGSSAVYGLLNVRSCYSNGSSGNNPSSHENPGAGPGVLRVRSCRSSNVSSNENPALLCEKVA